MTPMRAWLLAWLLPTLWLTPSAAAQTNEVRAQIRLESRAAYAGMPMVVAVSVEGFDETPPPALPPLTITGATVKPLGASPQVSRGMQIINGRRTTYSSVTWILRWEVVAARAGRLEIPAVRVVQGSKTAQTKPAALDVAELPLSSKMTLRLQLPTRPIWLGETLTAKLVWEVPQDHGEPEFVLPFLQMDQSLTVSAPPAEDKQKTYPVDAGGRKIELPYSQTVTGGRRTFEFELLLTPKQVGQLAIAPSTVVVSMGGGRIDWFGNSVGRLERATDVEHTLDVRELPTQGRPAAFAGVVGSRLGINVATSKSVVEMGEPVRLTVTLTGPDRLDHVALGKITLPTDHFSVPPETPVGTLSADGKSKSFAVDVQVIGPATEIPAIPFAYFDPSKGAYQTVLSQPIALSVRGGKRVGAADVVSGQREAGTAAPTGAQLTSLVGADLSLSSGAADRSIAGLARWWQPLTAALYGVPPAVLLLMWLWRRRAQARAHRSPSQLARERVEAELARATTLAARDAAGPLVAALTDWAKQTGIAVPDGLRLQLERTAYSGSAAAEPIAAATLAEVRRLVATASRAKRHASAALLLLGSLTLTRPAHAEAPAQLAEQVDDLAPAQAAYHAAMAATDPSERRTLFLAARDKLAPLAGQAPARLTDWGNAALGAGDFGTATLAYLRAERMGGDARAAKNLAWLRSHRPAELLRGPDDSRQLLFFAAWPRPSRWILSGLAFAIAVALLARRSTRWYALMPAALWLAMLATLATRSPAVGVILQPVPLRAADATGAPHVLAEPLPAGTEVRIVSAQPGWFNVAVGAHSGWLPDSALARP